MKPAILIVEDEAPLAELIRYNIQTAGFEARLAQDGEDALLQISENPPDLIVLDWMLPQVSGVEICRRLRAQKNNAAIPIIMLTARGEEADRLRGLESGADDYMVKPFSPAELVARIKAVIRRSRPAAVGDVLSYGGITLDPVQHKVYRDGRPLHLGPKEFRLLATFLERPMRVFSRSQLLDLVWGRGIYVEERTVDVHIRRLRKALNAVGDVDPIRTVRGGGYAIDTDCAHSSNN